MGQAKFMHLQVGTIYMCVQCIYSSMCIRISVLLSTQLNITSLSFQDVAEQMLGTLAGVQGDQ